MPINFTDALDSLNPARVPIPKTHFYRHLKLGGYSENALTCIKQYLGGLGYIQGTDTLHPKMLARLNLILDQYYHLELR
jgi:hypothetical protein